MNMHTHRGGGGGGGEGGRRRPFSHQRGEEEEEGEGREGGGGGGNPLPGNPDNLTAATLEEAAGSTQSHVVVGRHGIRIRPWPHPDPVEVMRAHRIVERVQEEQYCWYGVREPRQVLVVTPTDSRAF
ncbi:putative glucuronosyltransferase [Hordeum vulgare]|nr:putative glucuronosyltransferase [Hordeum vulgare]